MPENVSNYLKGLPISELIASPLRATCDAQRELSQAAYDYMMQIGFKNGNVDDGPNLVKFNLQRPVETPTGISVSEVEVQAPFLGLVPIPSLLVDKVDIEFQMEVNGVDKTTTKTEAELTTSAKFKSWMSPVTVDVTGKVSSSRENTRETNQTAKYQVKVTAAQQAPTEGLSKLMDILASCTAPLSVKGESS